MGELTKEEKDQGWRLVYCHPDPIWKKFVSIKDGKRVVITRKVWPKPKQFAVRKLAQ